MSAQGIIDLHLILGDGSHIHMAWGAPKLDPDTLISDYFEVYNRRNEDNPIVAATLGMPGKSPERLWFSREVLFDPIPGGVSSIQAAVG